MTSREPPPGWGQPPLSGWPSAPPGSVPVWAPPPLPAEARPAAATGASALLIVEALLLFGVAALGILYAVGAAFLSVADSPPDNLGSRLGSLAAVLLVVLGAYPTLLLVLGVRLRRPGRTVDWWLAAGLQGLTVAVFVAAAIAAGSPGHPTEQPLGWPARVLLGAIPALLPAAVVACLSATSTRRFHHVGRPPRP
jgi:hypothetical protein